MSNTLWTARPKYDICMKRKIDILKRKQFKVKLIFLVLLVTLTACSTGNVMPESIESDKNKSLSDALNATSTSLVSTTIENNDSQISNNNFLNAWKKTLKDELILDSNEIALTKELEELMIWKGDKYNLNQYLYEIEVNNLTCTRLYNSMGWALFDQIHPIEKDFRSSHTYKCDESGELYLFGSPFYYQGNWWIFHNIEVDFSTLDCETPCGISAQFFASKFKINYPKDLLNN